MIDVESERGILTSCRDPSDETASECPPATTSGYDVEASAEPASNETDALTMKAGESIAE